MFVAGLGVPRDVIDLCHQRGVLVASMCGRSATRSPPVRGRAATS